MALETWGLLLEDGWVRGHSTSYTTVTTDVTCAAATLLLICAVMLIKNRAAVPLGGGLNMFLSVSHEPLSWQPRHVLDNVAVLFYHEAIAFNKGCEGVRSSRLDLEGEWQC